MDIPSYLDTLSPLRECKKLEKDQFNTLYQKLGNMEVGCGEELEKLSRVISESVLADKLNSQVDDLRDRSTYLSSIELSFKEEWSESNIENPSALINVVSSIWLAGRKLVTVRDELQSIIILYCPPAYIMSTCEIDEVWGKHYTPYNREIATSCTSTSELLTSISNDTLDNWSDKWIDTVIHKLHEDEFYFNENTAFDPLLFIAVKLHSLAGRLMLKCKDIHTSFAPLVIPALNSILAKCPAILKDFDAIQELISKKPICSILHDSVPSYKPDELGIDVFQTQYASLSDDIERYLVICRYTKLRKHYDEIFLIRSEEDFNLNSFEESMSKIQKLWYKNLEESLLNYLHELEFLSICESYANVEEYDKALLHIDMYMKTHDNDPNAFYFRRVFLEKQGRLQEAISAFTNSLSLKPKQEELIVKICEVVCCLDKPSDVQAVQWLEQAKQVGAPLRVLQSLEEKLALARQDLHTLDKLYQDQYEKAPDDLNVIEKIVNLKISLEDLQSAKRIVDEINSRLPRVSDNLNWIQLSYAVYDRVYISCQSERMLAEQVPLLFGMLSFLSSIFFIKLSVSDDKEVKDELRQFDSHLSALHSALEKVPYSPPQRQSYQLRLKENFALFYQMAAYLLFKLAYDQILDLNEMLQLAAVCLSISFSITPPISYEEGTEELLHVANCRMCVVGYLFAALIKLYGQDWLNRIVKPKISDDGLSRIIEVLQLQVVLQPSSCIRLPMIDITQVLCASPSRSHLSRYHEAYIRENLFQLPSLTWLCLAEIGAYGGVPSLPQLFSCSEQRLRSFPEGSEDLNRTDFSSCSRMDIEAFLYMSLYETIQLETTVGDGNTVLLPIVLQKLKIPETRCNFWNSLHTLDRAVHDPNLLIKDESKHKTTVEKGLVSIRCLNKMELPTLIIFNIAKAFEHSFSCTVDSSGYSQDRQTLLLARRELYWEEALRRVQLNETGASSLRDDSISDCLATKSLSLQEKQARECLSEEESNTIRSHAQMNLGFIAVYRDNIVKAISIFEKLDQPYAGFNHAQLLKHIALNGNPQILSGAHARPLTSYDLFVRSYSILSEWILRNEVKQDTQLLNLFRTEIKNLDSCIPIEANTAGSAPPFSFPPQSATSSTKEITENDADVLNILKTYSFKIGEISLLIDKEFPPLTSELSEIISQISKSGKVCYPWRYLYTVILVKLTEILKDFDLLNIPEKEKPTIMIILKNIDLLLLHRFRNDPPFAIQRLCELLCFPKKYYKSLLKYIRAFEKVLTVISYSKVEFHDPNISPPQESPPITPEATQSISRKRRLTHTSPIAKKQKM